jgi:hypothetical protein
LLVVKHGECGADDGFVKLGALVSIDPSNCAVEVFERAAAPPHLLMGGRREGFRAGYGFR